MLLIPARVCGVGRRFVSDRFQVRTPLGIGKLHRAASRGLPELRQDETAKLTSLDPFQRFVTLSV